MDIPFNSPEIWREVEAHYKIRKQEMHAAELRRSGKMTFDHDEDDDEGVDDSIIGTPSAVPLSAARMNRKSSKPAPNTLEALFKRRSYERAS